MSEQANDNKPHDERTEPFKERIRACATFHGYAFCASRDFVSAAK